MGPPSQLRARWAVLNALPHDGFGQLDILRLHLCGHRALAPLRPLAALLPVVLAHHWRLLDLRNIRHQQERLPDAPDGRGDAAPRLRDGRAVRARVLVRHRAQPLRAHGVRLHVQPIGPLRVLPCVHPAVLQRLSEAVREGAVGHAARERRVGRLLPPAARARLHARP
eukprot:scaffold68726_cov75-Phaeocystis_antarctica.AAC.4